MVESSTRKLAFVFPGQGSQAVGMGKTWAEAFDVSKEAFLQANEALGLDLSKLCWEGPEEDLQLTANTQPAILATSVAVWRALDFHGVKAQVMAGHSLGEYSALVAAGVLDFADALRLVRSRGELMQRAVPVGDGAMAAILGMSLESLQEVVEAAAQNQICTIANLNAPGQTVIAGDRAAVERAIEGASQAGARRAVMLPVSAPFHSPLMEPVREALGPLLFDTDFADPSVPVVCNVDAEDVSSGDAARDALIRQVDAPVRWVESVRHIFESHNVTHFVEVGPGKVLSGLMRRIEKGLARLAVDGPESLGNLVEGNEN